MMWSKDYYRRGIIAGLALILAVTGGMLTAKRNTEYLETHPYYGDTASYTLFNIRVYLQSKSEGRWAALKSELRQNSRNPFRIIPILIIHPKWLASINGHLITASFMLFCFLLMLGLTVEWRTSNFSYACLSMLAVFTPHSFYHPTNGFGANYPDLTAGFFVGAAVLALLRSDEGRKNLWFIWFGVFAALAALSRWPASGYTFFICAPLLVYYLILRWRSGEKLWSSLIWKLVCVATPILLLAGYYLIRFSKDNIAYYSYAQYGFNQGYGRSIANLRGIVEPYFGWPGLALFLLLLIIYSVRWWKSKRKASDLLITAWVPCSFFILFVFIFKLAGDPSAPFYMIPLLQIFCLTPFALKRDVSQITTFSRTLDITLIAIVGLFAVWTYQNSWIAPPPKGHGDQIELGFQRKLTKTLIKNSVNSSATTFDTFFFPYGRSVIIDSVALYNKPLNWHQIYQKHNVFWEHTYPDLTPVEIGSKVYEQAGMYLDFIAIIDDPRAKIAESLFWSDFKEPQEVAIGVIEYMNQRLRQEQGEWEPLPKSLESPWGKVSIFRKRTVPKEQ